MNRHSISRFPIFLLLLLSSLSLAAQNTETFRVMFWNVENLFDTRHDSLKHDWEFLPGSAHGWNMERFNKKLADVARVITAVGEWNPPALVGLCEVENDNVLQRLTRQSPLKAHGYKYVITESADLRGIDVALLYQSGRFELLDYQAIRPCMGVGRRPTRDILHVVGRLPSRDTLDVFVVHSPSRSGGTEVTEPKRLLVAGLVRSAADSLMRLRREPRILIMGDLNDYPSNYAVAEVLGARAYEEASEEVVAERFYHLLAGSVGKGQGSYKYQGEWGLLDHLIVSGALLDAKSAFHTGNSKASVVRLPFLLAEDETFGGVQPFRTYQGLEYLGGYSDHLPVRADFQCAGGIK